MSQEVTAATPAAKTFRLGAFQVTVLRDSRIIVANNGSVFGLDASPTAVAKVLRDAGASDDRIYLDVDPLLVTVPDHRVLIDTGLGPAAKGVLRQSLALADVSPADITDVLITHSHSDHTGGLLDAQGRSAFPKATIRMSANEWSAMRRSAEGKEVAARIAGQVKTFEPGEPVLPGITPIALYGHTPGHVLYRIESAGQRLLDIGDTAHSSIISLAKPDWANQFDHDQAAGARQRRQELQQVAHARALIFAPHFPYPGVGRIEPSGDGFVFKPGLPAGK